MQTDSQPNRKQDPSTIFKGWSIDGYTAKSPDGKYELWIANGFSYFRDFDPHFPRQTLLKGVGTLRKHRLWREFKRERKLRFDNQMQGLLGTLPHEDGSKLAEGELSK